MQTFTDQHSVSLRPHTKAHKIPELATLQLEMGAKGICAAKLGKAEMMLASGIKDILITMPIVNPIKLERLANLYVRYPSARISIEPVFDFLNTYLTTEVLRPEIVSGGGSGTYDAYEAIPFTELQAGSYLFMDWDNHTIGSRNGSAHTRTLTAP